MKKTIILFIALLSPLSLAHPHAWVDVEITPVLNDKGEVVVLHQRWQFDPLFATMMLEEVDSAKDDGERKKFWDELVHDVTTTLKEEGYYTFPKKNFAPAENAVLSTENNDLFLDADLPLLKPTKTLRYQFYEPEYYVEMLHRENHTRDFVYCHLTILAAEPDEEKYMEAAALDITDDGDPNLGRFFAETGVLQCE